MDYNNAYLLIHGKLPNSPKKSPQKELKTQESPMKLKMTPSRTPSLLLQRPKIMLKSPKKRCFESDLLASPCSSRSKIHGSGRKKLFKLLEQDYKEEDGSTIEEKTAEIEEEASEEDQENDENVETTVFQIKPLRRSNNIRKKEEGNFVKVNMKCKKVIKKKNNVNNKKFFKKFKKRI